MQFPDQGWPGTTHYELPGFTETCEQIRRLNRGILNLLTMHELVEMSLLECPDASSRLALLI